RPERIGGGREERARPAQEPYNRVSGMEVRELEEILAVLDEDLHDRGIESRIGLHRNPGEGQADEVGSVPPDPEARNDPAARPATGVGTRLNLLPSMRTVAAMRSCSGFEPSGST